MQRCIELSLQSVKYDGTPFGSLVTKDNKIVAESANEASVDTTSHAEVLVMRKSKKVLQADDLSGCTLYTNCEPCPMCAFMIREFKISRVVFALKSPFMGGHTKWQILQDEELTQFKPVFADPPEVIIGICKEDAAKVFDDIGWTMHRK